MHFESSVQVEKIERSVPRPGFAEAFHRVSFTLRCDGIEPLSTAVWVHPSFPGDRIEAVALAFLKGRLDALAEAAGNGAMSSSEVDALWQAVKPWGY